MTPNSRTKRSRILSIAAWTFVVAISVSEIARMHNARFLPLFQMLTGLIVIFAEVKGLMEN